jgi:hypothetical protein
MEPLLLSLILTGLVAFLSFCLWRTINHADRTTFVIVDAFNRTTARQLEDREKELSEVECRWSRRLEEQKDRNATAFEKLTQSYMTAMTELSGKVKALGNNFSILAQEAVPVMLTRAKLREHEQDGREAARWLYLMHCLGLWVPGREDSHVLAHGQREAGTHPREIESLVVRMAAARKTPLIADSEVVGILRTWLLGSEPKASPMVVKTSEG